MLVVAQDMQSAALYVEGEEEPNGEEPTSAEQYLRLALLLCFSLSPSYCLM